MDNNTGTVHRATIMLTSGQLDRSMTAFEIATGLAAMGTQVDIWFIMYGVNCLKKPRSLFSLDKWRAPRKPVGEGRVAETDNAYQQVLRILNHDGAAHLPLSLLNYLGAGRWFMNRILRRKHIANLETLIGHAVQLGVRFKICQTCVDIMGINVDRDLIVKAEVLGVSTYALDTRDSYYNIVI